MALRILGTNGGATIAESTNAKPVCRYCDWLTLESIVLAGKKLEEFEEFVCQRHLTGWRNSRKCDY